MALLAALLLAAAGVGQDRSDARDRFAGAWRLARLEQPGADAKIPCAFR